MRSYQEVAGDFLTIKEWIYIYENKPLWIAPIIGIGACAVYRLIWVVICLILEKISRL